MLVQLVGANIRSIRLSQGFKLEKFALKIEIETSFFGHIERGEKNVELRTLWRIAAGLNVQPFELFRENNSETPFPTLDRFVERNLTAYIRPALLRNYDSIKLLALFESDMLKKLTVQDIEDSANR